MYMMIYLDQLLAYSLSHLHPLIFFVASRQSLDTHKNAAEGARLIPMPPTDENCGVGTMVIRNSLPHV